MRIADLAGRGLCEAAYSKAMVALTLTYADTDYGYEHHLTKSHFQEFIRALRDTLRSQKTIIRYISAGELGERKGRAHFHCILFFDNFVPDWPQRKRFHIDQWKWGHVYADRINPSLNGDKSVRYVAKYMLKDKLDKQKDSWFSLSKNPILGDKFITWKAAQNVAANVWPSTFCYRPPFSDGRKTYIFRGAARRKFMERVIAGHASYGRRPILDGNFSESTRVQFQACWKKFRIDEANDMGLTYQIRRIAEDIERYRPTQRSVFNSLNATETFEEVYNVTSSAESDRRIRRLRERSDDAATCYANHVERAKGDTTKSF